MTLVSSSIPNLVNGVSQQPPAIRLASQCDLQENALSSVATGVGKRPPTHHRAKIRNTPLDGAFVHTVNRDTAEQYTVVIENGDLHVYRMDGTEVTVNFPNGKGYLASAAPLTDFRAVSVVDYTFILNRSLAVAIDPTPLPKRPFEAVVWVKQGAYASTYNMNIGGVVSSFTTADASQPANARTVQTDLIATQLEGQIAQQLADRGIFSVRNGSYIYYTSANDFQVLTADSLGDTAIHVIKDSVQNFSDLPAKCTAGFTVQVTGSNETKYDDYFVTYTTTAANPNGGVWVECAKPAEAYKLNGGTLPHALVREADGTFSLKVPDWATRGAGSLDTLGFPSFIGSKVEDIFFHRNRLGMLAGENVILSRAGEFFNLLRKTALQLLDTDPIDVAVATGGGASPLRHAVAFNDGLLLFSDQVQFQFGKADLLTPKTASITLTTQFGCNIKAKPVGSGKNVYFTTTRGDYSAVREYYLDVDTRANDAADITAHVPRYVPRDITKLAATPNEDIVVMASAADPSGVYAYRYYWQGNAKLQSSWSRWEFGAGARVLSLAFIESSLWVCVARDDGTYLEELHLQPDRVDAGLTFEYLLDRRVSPALAYDAATRTTRFKVPYALPSGDTHDLVASAPSTDFRAGQAVPFRVLSADSSGTTVAVSGQLAGAVFGRRYEMRYGFSTLYIREEAPGGGQQPVMEGRLQLRKMTLAHANTGTYRVEVTPLARGTFTYPFSGRVLGSAVAPIGAIALNTGNFSFTLAAKNDEVGITIVNDSPLPSTFLGASWEGFYVSRSRRI